MPPVLLFGLGMIGAALVGRFILREARRINAELHPDAAPRAHEPEPRQKLERDPETGIYRPR